MTAMGMVCLLMLIAMIETHWTMTGIAMMMDMPVGRNVMIAIPITTQISWIAIWMGSLRKRIVTIKMRQLQRQEFLENYRLAQERVALTF